MFFLFFFFFVVKVLPESSVVGVGQDTITFICNSRFISVRWLLNGTRRDLYNNAYWRYSSSTGRGSLRFKKARLEQNNTRVQCLGTTAQRVTQVSIPALLYVEGHYILYISCMCAISNDATV